MENFDIIDRLLQRNMKELCFQIFSNLDYISFTKCKTVCQSWNTFLEQEFSETTKGMKWIENKISAKYFDESINPIEKEYHFSVDESQHHSLSKYQIAGDENGICALINNGEELFYFDPNSMNLIWSTKSIAQFISMESRIYLTQKAIIIFTGVPLIYEAIGGKLHLLNRENGEKFSEIENEHGFNGNSFANLSNDRFAIVTARPRAPQNYFETVVSRYVQFYQIDSLNGPPRRILEDVVIGLYDEFFSVSQYLLNDGDKILTTSIFWQTSERNNMVLEFICWDVLDHSVEEISRSIPECLKSSNLYNKDGVRFKWPYIVVERGSQNRGRQTFNVVNIQDGTEVRRLQMPDEDFRFRIKKILWNCDALLYLVEFGRDYEQKCMFLKWSDVIDPNKSNEQIMERNWRNPKVPKILTIGIVDDRVVIIYRDQEKYEPEKIHLVLMSNYFWKNN